MVTKHTSVKIPDELEEKLMKIAAEKYNNNKSMTIIKAIEQFVDNPDFQTDSEIDLLKKKVASIDQELTQLKQKLLIIESSLAQLLLKAQ